MPDRQLTATDVPSSRPTARPGGAGRGATRGQSPPRRVKGRGNVGQLVRASDRSLVARYEYDPHGNTITATGPIAAANPFRFSAKWWDTEAGLGYWGYRYYSPRLGRWMSRDPMGESGATELRSANHIAKTKMPMHQLQLAPTRFPARDPARRYPDAAAEALLFAKNSPPNYVDSLGDEATPSQFGTLGIWPSGTSTFSRTSVAWSIVGRIGDFVGQAQACKDALSAVLTDLVSNLIGGSERFPGKSDGFYHCYHSCKLAAGCGDNLSMFLGAIREALQQVGDYEGALQDMMSNVDGINCATRKCPRSERTRECINCCNNALATPG